MKIYHSANQVALIEDLPEHRKASKTHKLLREIESKIIVPPHYVCVQTDAQLAEAVEAAQASPRLCIDIESRGLNWKKHKPVCLNLYTPSNSKAYVIPNRMVHALRNFSDGEIATAFRDIFESKPILNHNIKFDIQVMNEHWGIDVGNIYFDTMLASILLNENEPHDLEALCVKWLKKPKWKQSHAAPFETWPMKVATLYGGKDVEMPVLLTEFQQQHLNRPELAKLRNQMYNIKLPLIRPTVEKERHGIGWDADYHRDIMLPTVTRNAEAAAAKVLAVTGPINLNAPAQVASALYDMLELPRPSDRSNSVAAYPLQQLANMGHQIAQDTLDQRKWTKIKEAFADTLPDFVINGRIHTTLNIDGARKTGRFSCDRPNLQQIPKRIGPLIRKGFIPSPGCIFVAFDYSQMELRMLAHFSGDETLIAAFKSGQDIHTAVMCEVFHIDYDYYQAHQDDDDMVAKRTATKNINFGVLYGMGPHSLAIRINSTDEEAVSYIKQWFGRFPKVKEYIAQCEVKAFRQGYVETLLGRKRRLPDAKNPDRAKYMAANREAVNAPIQGCLSGDSWILTQEHGLVRIADVAYHPITVWDGGSFVKASVLPSGKKQLCKVTIGGRHQIECSPEHRILVRNTKGVEAFREVEDLADLAQNYAVPSAEVATPEWHSPIKLPRVYAYSHAARELTLDLIVDKYELGLFLGRLASDGTVHGADVALMVAEHEESILPRLRAIMIAAFGTVREWTTNTGRVGSPKMRKDATPCRPIHWIAVTSKSLTEQLIKLDIKYRMPSCVMQDSDALRGYLCGMFDGDGGVTRNRVDGGNHKGGVALTFGKIRRKLEWARDIQKGLQFLGIESRLALNAGSVRVGIMARDLTRFADCIGFINPKKQQSLREIIAKWPSDPSNIYGRAQIVRDVEITDEFVDMYDVVNSETRKFCVNGFVTHNSVSEMVSLTDIEHNRIIKEQHWPYAGILQIHDELLYEVPETWVQHHKHSVEVLQQTMANIYPLQVPVEVSVQYLKKWGDKMEPELDDEIEEQE